MLRGLLVDGKPDAATVMFTVGVKFYPLSEAANPPQMEFMSASTQVNPYRRRSRVSGEVVRG